MGTPSQRKGQYSPRQKTARGPSLFFKAFCVSIAFHAAMFGIGAWITLTKLSSFGTGHGSIVRVSLIAAADAWTGETVPPPLELVAADRRPVETKVRAAKPTRVARSQPPRPIPSPAGQRAHREALSTKPLAAPEFPKQEIPSGPSRPEPSPAGRPSPAPVRQEPPQANALVASTPPAANESYVALEPSAPTAPQLAPKGIQVVGPPSETLLPANDGLAASRTPHGDEVPPPQPPLTVKADETRRAPERGQAPPKMGDAADPPSNRHVAAGVPLEAGGDTGAENRTTSEKQGTPIPGGQEPSQPSDYEPRGSGEVARRELTPVPAMLPTTNTAEPATSPPVVASVAKHAEEFRAGAASVELPRTPSESVPAPPAIPPAPVHVASVPATEPHAPAEPQDPGKPPTPSASPDQPSRLDPPPRPAMADVSETRALPLLVEDDKPSSTKGTAATDAMPSKPSASEPGQSSGPPEPPLVENALDRLGEASKTPVPSVAAQASTEGGRPVDRTNGDRDTKGKDTRANRVRGGEGRRVGRAAGVQGDTRAEGRKTEVATAPQPGASGANGTEGSTEIRGTDLASADVVPGALGSREAGGHSTSQPSPQVQGGLGEAASDPSGVEPARIVSVGSAASEPEAVSTARTAEGSTREPPSSSGRQAESPPPFVQERTGQSASPQVDVFPAVDVQIERPHAGTTTQGTQVVAGQVTGGRAKGVVVQLNESRQLLDVCFLSDGQKRLYRDLLTQRCQSLGL